jgi:hypothetical protein
MRDDFTGRPAEKPETTTAQKLGQADGKMNEEH